MPGGSQGQASSGGVGAANQNPACARRTGVCQDCYTTGVSQESVQGGCGVLVVRLPPHDWRQPGLLHGWR
eukprot:4332587-Pyramimonas_sp.AAC.1